MDDFGVGEGRQTAHDKRSMKMTIEKYFLFTAMIIKFGAE